MTAEVILNIHRGLDRIIPGWLVFFLQINQNKVKMASRLAWFATTNGRYTMGLLATVTACGTFVVSFVPQTMCLDKYHDFVILRKFDRPVAVSPQLQKLWNEVLDDLSLDRFQRTILKPLMVLGFDPWHAGSLESKFGALIGLPINFTYTEIGKIEKEQILINNEPVNWNRDDARNLLKNLILSDDAKKYAMAREILMTNNVNMYLQSIASSSIFGVCYILGVQVNQSLSLFQKPLSLRVIIYTLIGGFFWGIWAMQKDAITRYYEHTTDEYLSHLGVNYIKGAIEFYDKTLKRNIAMRSLNTYKGEDIFTAGGNMSYIIRMKNLPLSHRKNFFEDKLKALETAKTDDIAITFS